MPKKRVQTGSGEVERLKNRILVAEKNARDVNSPASVSGTETPAATQRRMRSAQRWRDRARDLRKQLQDAKTRGVRSRQKPKHV